MSDATTHAPYIIASSRFVTTSPTSDSGASKEVEPKYDATQSPTHAPYNIASSRFVTTPPTSDSGASKEVEYKVQCQIIPNARSLYHS